MADLIPIPYEAIASAALSSIETLLGRWLPGGNKKGGEYFVCNPLRADSKPNSFAINLTKGKWGDFATNDAGNDLISLYAYLEGIEQWEAAIDVADQIAFNLPEACRPKTKNTTERKNPVINPESIKQAKPPVENHWYPVTPVPTDAEEAPLAHPHRGLPALKWAYKDAKDKLLGYVYRFNTSDGGKETLPLTYCKHEISGKYEWRWMQWTSPNRPLYGLDRLAAKPDAYVLLVEGEKCADAPVDMLQCAVVTWSGGSKAVDKADWVPLAGRKIYAWADCDAQREKLSKEDKDAGIDPLSKPLLAENEQPGMKAMLRIRDKLLELDPTTDFNFVNIPKPLEKPAGWDIADAIEEGMNAPALLTFITNTRPQPVLAVSNSETGKGISTPPSADAEEKKNPDDAWMDYLLRTRGELVACLANVYDILKNDKVWNGVFGFNEHSLTSVKLKPPPYWDMKGEAGDFTDVDASLTAMWLTRKYRFNPKPSTATNAVETLAHSNKFHPIRDYLNGLQWDGVKRVDNWLKTYLGVPFTDYSKRVARWYLMGMVLRVMRPGCKFDYCLVLEGDQGYKKSTALRALAGEWFGDTDLDLNHKDSMSALRGKWLYEFSELGSLAKSEATKQKSFLSRQVDEFRPTYGTREIKAPRQLVFAGSTNEWEWNKDPTGGRRFWPIKVLQQVDVEGIEANRDQLFAEAVVMVNEGFKHWPTLEEQKKYFDPEQLKRSIPDGFIDGLYDHVQAQFAEFTLYYAATEWLKLSARDLTPPVQTRIGIALRQLGCTKVERRGNETRFWYKPPERKDATLNNPGERGGNDDPLF